MAKCTICDAVLPADALYCAKCGAKVNRAGDIGPPPGAKPFVGTSNTGTSNTGNSNSGDSNAGGSHPDQVDANAPSERIRTHQAGGPRRTDTVEEEVWTGTYSPKAMATPIVGGGLLTIAIIVGWIIFRESITWWWMPLIGIVLIWVLIGGKLLYRMYSVRYRLTNQRFFHEKGILRRVVDRIEVIDLDDITYIQNILDRMLNIGTIKITSSDRTHPELVLRGIDNVKDVAAKIDAARRAERIRRGLHIEAI